MSLIRSAINFFLVIIVAGRIGFDTKQFTNIIAAMIFALSFALQVGSARVLLVASSPTVVSV